jgi:hypothetical protein
MYRGRNTDRLIYGHDYAIHGEGTATFEDVRLHGKPQPKTHKPAKKTQRTCQFCGATFLSGRADAKCCPRPMPCRLGLERRQRSQRFQKLFSDLDRGR